MQLDHLIGGLGGLSESSVRDLKIDFQANVDLKEDFFEDLEIELRKLPETSVSLCLNSIGCIG